MKQEDKKLLLQDLCARIPYGVKIWYKYYPDKVTERFATSIRVVNEKIVLSSKFNKEGDSYPIEEANELLIKPYLRSLSSMTNEEKEYFRQNSARVKVLVDVEKLVVKEYYSYTIHLIDWLNSRHLDYRGLIQKGLALEASKEMYNTNDLIKL